MTALIIGASGLVGHFCLQKLLASNKYQKVISVGRKQLELQNPKLEQIVIELQDLQKYQDKLVANDYFCCLGTTIKAAKTKENFKKVDFEAPYALAKIAKYHNANHFLIVTALGSNSQSKIFYNQVKGQLEDELKKLKLNSLCIFQPSLLLGQRKEFRLGEKIFEKSQYLPIWFGSLKKYQPIPAEAVAQAMVSATSQNTSGIHIVPSHEMHYLGLGN